MSDERPLDPADGGVTTEVRGRILLMGLDRPAKMNGYTPQLARPLGRRALRPWRAFHSRP